MEYNCSSVPTYSVHVYTDACNTHYTVMYCSVLGLANGTSQNKLLVFTTKTFTMMLTKLVVRCLVQLNPLCDPPLLSLVHLHGTRHKGSYG